MSLHKEISLSAQASYAGLDLAARDLSLSRGISDVPGGFAKHTVKGRIYWYHHLKLPDGRLKQSYIGPDDEQTRSLIERHANPLAKQSAENLQKSARACIELGCADVPLKHARVINRLADCGLFFAGGILIGTHAFLAYQNTFGVRWDVGAYTLDLDFAHAGRNISLALPENLEINTTSAIESLEMGFIPNQSKTTFRKADEPEFDLDFLTSRGRTGDKPVTINRLGLTLQPLRFMELSLEDPMRSTLLSRHGPIVVNIPRPERYAIHKLLVSCERPLEQRVKAKKDITQAAALFEYLLANDPADLARIWAHVKDSGPTWRKNLLNGFSDMNRAFPMLNFDLKMSAIRS